MQASNRSPLLFLALGAILAASLLAGCGDSAPSKDHLKLTLEPLFTSEGPLEITKVEPAWVKTGDARLEGKASVTLKLKEDCYTLASLDEALADLKLDSAVTALLRQSLSLARDQAEPLRSSLMGKAPKSLESHSFIQASEKSGKTISAEVILTAQKIEGGWNLDIHNLSLSPPLSGRPRATLPESALIVGSPEAKKLIEGGVKAIRQYAETVEQAVADGAKVQAEAKAKRREAWLAALKPGSIFVGTVEDAKTKSLAETGFMIEELQPVSGTVKGFMFEDDPRKQTPVMGVLRETEAPLLLNIAADPPLVAELDLSDGRLVGTMLNPENPRQKAAVLWGPADKESLEAKTAALVAAENAAKAEAERQAAERKKQEDEYQAALSAALAPGQAFQGVWSGDSRRDEIGLAIESVSANGLTASGYLFDPQDRLKRKPFTANVNRDHEAQDALTVTASGQGLDEAAQKTDMQRHWLGAGDYSLKLALKNGGWTGEGRGKGDLAPVPDFAALLAQDQVVLEDYQKALAEAIAPGRAFQGEWLHPDQKDLIAEIGLTIESVSADGRSAAGYLFAPQDRKQRKPFTARINRAHGAPDALEVTVTYNQGGSDSDQITKGQNSWLAVNRGFSVELALKNGGWTGKTTRTSWAGNQGVTGDFAPIPDFAALLAQDAEAEKKQQEAEKAALVPGTEYRGTWKNDKYPGGLIGLKMLTLSSSGNNFTAELFDPDEPAVLWPHTGSIITEDGRKNFLLRLDSDPKNLGSISTQEGGTQWMLKDRCCSRSEVQLRVTGETLSGHIKKPRDLFECEFKKISPVAPEAAAQAVATPAPTAAASPPPPATASPAAPLAPAAVTATYPPLVSADGKPKAAAHLVRLENNTAELALQVLAPGKTIEAVRIDNIGGVLSRWRSDGSAKEESEPLAVSLGGQALSSGAQTGSLALGDAEALLALALTDNGAFAGKATRFRVTVFFAGGEQAMCLLAAQ